MFCFKTSSYIARMYLKVMMKIIQRRKSIIRKLRNNHRPQKMKIFKLNLKKKKKFIKLQKKFKMKKKKSIVQSLFFSPKKINYIFISSNLMNLVQDLIPCFYSLAINSKCIGYY